MISLLNRKLNSNYSFSTGNKLETEEDIIRYFLDYELNDNYYEVEQYDEFLNPCSTILLDNNYVYNLSVVISDGFFHTININFFACGD